MKHVRSQGSYRRAIPLALFWVAAQSALYGYIHVNGLGQPVANHLPLISLFFLIVLVFAVNPLLRGSGFGRRLTTTELTVVWVMVSAAASVPGYGLMEFIFPYIAAPLYYATPENQWTELLFPHLKEWLYVSDPIAVRDFWEGLSPGDTIRWEAWLRPGAFAVGLGLAFFFTVGCWSVIVRRQWIERERYAFPLVQVTYELTHADPAGRGLQATFRSPLFWVGVAIGVVPHLMRGLHRMYPVLPDFQTHFPLTAYFPNKPWKALVTNWPVYPRVYMSVIGVTYFLQLDVALSLWVFFLFYKFQQVAFSAFAITAISTQQQVMGAVLMLAAASLWQARRHLATVIRTGLSPPRADGYDADEPTSYRTALIGMTLGFIAWGGMCIVMGMTPWMAVLFVGLMWIMATTAAWHVANAGCLLVNVGFTPWSFFTMALGSRLLGTSNLIQLSYVRSSIPNWSSQSLMAYSIQNWRLTDMHRLDARRLRLPQWMIVAVVFACVVTFIATLNSIYHGGGLSKTEWIFRVGARTMQRPERALNNPFPPNLPGIMSAGIGSVVMAFLLFMRHRFLWWPLHPLGYALGVTWAPARLWFSTLLGWSIKLTVLQFAGFGAYRKWRPCFVGMIVGEYGMTVLWNLIGLKTGLGYWGPPS